VDPNDDALRCPPEDEEKGEVEDDGKVLSGEGRPA
jgi:hypothetical protein